MTPLTNSPEETLYDYNQSQRRHNDKRLALSRSIECFLSNEGPVKLYHESLHGKSVFFSCRTVDTFLIGIQYLIIQLPLYLSLFNFFIFLQCPHLYICIVCMYIWLNCIYLYLNVYCQCLMLTVCTKGQRVTQFQFSVCMYCTCGRIDNKADLTWLDLRRMWHVSALLSRGAAKPITLALCSYVSFLIIFVCLFHGFALYLQCALCYFIYLFACLYFYSCIHS